MSKLNYICNIIAAKHLSIGDKVMFSNLQNGMVYTIVSKTSKSIQVDDVYDDYCVCNTFKKVS